MKCIIPEISWHNRDPVLTIDIQPSKDEFYRLASGGTDTHVLIWHININQTTSATVKIVADLTRHQRAVNVVKWSPSGILLASGDDESVIFIWKMKPNTTSFTTMDNIENCEDWVAIKVLRGHLEDIYDLCWDPKSIFLVSGSVDNTAIIWNVSEAKPIATLNDHQGFVQGVAWDPRDEYIATLSSDRFLRIFDVASKKLVQRVSKSIIPTCLSNEDKGKYIRLFHDDTLQTFFRRLTFSPDGNLLVTPAGVIDSTSTSSYSHMTYIFSRYYLKQPAIMLPSPDQYTVAVKFCPVFFKLRTNNNSAMIPLPYRMVFSVATNRSVYLYDTQQKVPFGIISNIHYTRLTEMSWSRDGKLLVVSSTDGFCSVVTFLEGELGEVYCNTGTKEFPFEINSKIEEEMNSSCTSVSPPIDCEVSKIYDKGVCEYENANEFLRNFCTKENQGSIFSQSSGNSSIIIKSNIISSKEKFHSPDKKSVQATPISFRRHPAVTKTSFTAPGNLATVTTQDQFIIHSPLTKSGNESSQISTLNANENNILLQSLKTSHNVFADQEIDEELTEDLRLVYEDSNT